MIVPMKKLAVIVPAAEAAAAAEALRSLGIVHVQHTERPLTETVSALQDKRALLQGALAVIDEHAKAGRVVRQREAPDWMALSRHIIDQHKRIDQLSEYARGLHDRISAWECWGDFDPAAVRALAEKNIFVRFYRIPAVALRALPRDIPVQVCGRKKGMVWCAVISYGHESSFDYKPLDLPPLGLMQMHSRRDEVLQTIDRIRRELSEAGAYAAYYGSVSKGLEEDLECARAIAGMGREGVLSYLVGFIPHDTVDLVTAAVRKQRWGTLITEPDEHDSVPTFIRNPRWVSLISPVFRLIEVVPGYRELDTSLWFLLFFSVFCGIIIGDAGYGAIFLLITALAQKKWGSNLKQTPLFGLVYLTSGCAVAWGVLSGTFFGQAWLPEGVGPVLPSLRSDSTVQRICFFLGATHLTIAHLWRLIIKLPSPTAIAEAGWVGILWGAFFLANMLILSDPLPAGVWALIGAGALCVILFVEPRRNILQGILSGLGTLALNIVNNFTDVVSYIRLFAVGLAAVAVADAFNNMAMEIGFGSFIAGLGAALIILVGHLLNLVLTPMSILVHGVRLNILEFSVNHLGITWSGKAYAPFKKAKEKNDGQSMVTPV